MTTYIIAVIVVAAVSIFLCVWGERDFHGFHFAAFMIGTVGCFVALVGAVFIGTMSIGWVGSSHKADIINREYGTNYTQAEIFYASSVIDTIRELDRRRFEVNGDFRRAHPDPNVQARREKKQ